MTNSACGSAKRLETHIFVIGTSHVFQARTSRTTMATQESFKALVQDASTEHRVRLIAEEWSDEGLRIDGVAQTICDEVSAEKLNSKSCYVDPNNDERRELGIEDVGHIERQILHSAIMQAPRGARREDISKQTARRTAADPRVRASHEKRETEWIRRLKMQDVFPVLLVCGADHVHSFTDLAKRNGLTVTLLHADWQPT
jgi:hypothetical protein